MRIYVLCETYTDYGQYDQDTVIEKFKDVATNEKVVVIWARQADPVDKPICKIYDDVGVYEGEVDLEETARLGKVVTI